MNRGSSFAKNPMGARGSSHLQAARTVGPPPDLFVFFEMNRGSSFAKNPMGARGSSRLQAVRTVGPPSDLAIILLFFILFLARTVGPPLPESYESSWVLPLASSRNRGSSHRTW